MSDERRNEAHKVIAHAPAKINLSLLALPLQAGEEKHRLDSIFCTLALSDTLVFNFVSGPEPFNAQVTVESADFDTSFIKVNDNTLTKTVEHFKREYGFGFLPSGTLEVTLVKSIPTQAGLGGGSSNAAAVLRMLCWLSQVDPLSQRSISVAQAVGADVPFFLYAPKAGFCARMQRYGDELVEVLPKPNLPVALVKPNKGVSTRKAFAAFDAEDHRQLSHEAIERMVTALKSEASPAEIAGLCVNNLEPAAREILPILSSIKQELASIPGVLGVSMSGSGATVFALCADAASARLCIEHAAEKELWAVATQT